MQALHSVPIFSSNGITSSVKVVFALLSGHNMKSDLLGWWILGIYSDILSGILSDIISGVKLRSGSAH